jgi:hypothetical protein
MREYSLAILRCETRAHCRACRTDPDWCERVVGAREFECPHGVTAGSLPSRGLGDTIAKATKAVGIKPCGGCKKRQAILNKIVPYKK